MASPVHSIEYLRKNDTNPITQILLLIQMLGQVLNLIYVARKS